MKHYLLTVLGVLFSTTVYGADMKPEINIPSDANNFYQSKQLNKKEVSFNSLYDIKVAGNLYTPKNMNKKIKYPAIIIGHPMGAVKEQSANLYAQKMADTGFVTLSIDLPFWGASGGTPRNSVSPDIYAEAFSAAVDYLGTQNFIDRERIGVIGICGSGSFAISAAKIDSRIKAIATISMYDMGAASRDALNKSLSLEQRKQIIADAAEQRYIEFAGVKRKYTSGTVDKIDENSHPIAVEFFEFYRTARGLFTPKGATKETTTHPTLTSNVKFMNFYPLNDLDMISPRPMMFVAGEKAHSLEFSQEAYKKAHQPKELVIVPNAGHVDLYDRTNLIPFDKLENFFKNSLGV